MPRLFLIAVYVKSTMVGVAGQPLSKEAAEIRLDELKSSPHRGPNVTYKIFELVEPATVELPVKRTRTAIVD